MKKFEFDLKKEIETAWGRVTGGDKMMIKIVIVINDRFIVQY